MKIKISEEIINTVTRQELLKKTSEDGLHVKEDYYNVTITEKLVTYDDESTETIIDRQEEEIEKPSGDPFAGIDNPEKPELRKLEGGTWYTYNYDTSAWDIDSDQTDRHTIFNL